MAPILPREEESSSDFQPNLPLVIALSIAGIAVLLTAIPAGIYLRRQFWPQRNTFQVASVDRLPDSRFAEKYRSGDAQGVVPLMSSRRPASGRGDSLVLFDPYEPYRSNGQALPNFNPYDLETSNHRDSWRDAEDRGLLSHSRPQSRAFTPPHLSTDSTEPATETSPFMEEVTLRDLPAFSLPGTPIKELSPPRPQTGDTVVSSATEVTLVAPGQDLSKSTQYARPLPPPPPPPSRLKSVSEVPPDTNEDSDSESDTDSEYSQVSASTRHHLALAQGLAIPQPSASTPRHVEGFHQAPTSSFLKTRDSQVPNRQSTGAPQIEPLGSTVPPPRGESEVKGEDPHRAHYTRGVRVPNPCVASIMPASNSTAPIERRPNVQQHLRVSKRGSLAA